MICLNCGSNNTDGSKFCIKCGTSMQIQNIQNNSIITPEPVLQNDVNINNLQSSTAMPLNSYTNYSNSNSSGNFSIFAFLIAMLLKPIQCFKEEINNLINPKNTIILSCVIAGAMVVINLIKSMLMVVVVKTMNYSTFKYKTEWKFDNLKDLDYLSLIGKNFLIYAGIIVTIALVYFLGGLVAKKSVSFVKILAVSASSLISYVLLGMVVSPIVTKIWAPFGAIIMIVGIVYSLLIFINLINEEIKFDNLDYQIYYHLVCLSILISVGLYAYMKILTSGI